MEQEVNPEEVNQEEDEPSLAELVVELYQDCLLRAYIISSSFKDILENKLDRIKRTRNLLFIILLLSYDLPRYSFFCYLNTRDQETKDFWRNNLADTFNELGMFGQVMNAVYAVFALTIGIDMSYMYVFEAKGRLDYLTNISSLLDSKEEDDSQKETLGNKDKTRFLLKMKRKLLILKVSIKLVIGSVLIYELIGTPLFLFNKRPALTVGFYAVFNMIIMLYILYTCVHVVFTIYASYVLVSDYFTARMDYISMELEKLKNDYMEEQVNRLLFLYNELVKDFKKQDYLLKYLLRNLIYSYCIALAVVFLTFTVELNPFLRPVFMTAMALLAMGMMLAGLYVGRLQSRVMGLYEEMNQVFARNLFNERFSLKSRRNLLNCIKELGSQETDGQFVLGLRDGHGAATSSLEMFQLTMNTVGNTLMFMGFI